MPGIYRWYASPVVAITLWASAVAFAQETQPAQPPAPNAQPPVVPNAQPPVVPNTQPPVVPNAQPPVVPNAQPPVVPNAQPPVVPKAQPAINPPGQNNNPPANPAEKALQDLQKLGDPAALDKALQQIPQGAGPDQMKEMLKTMTELQKIQTEVFKSLPIRDFAQQLRTMGGGSPQAATGAVPDGGNKGRLGARLVPVPPAAADALKLPPTQGLWVIDVWPNSAADKAGIKVNDILIELAGKTVTNNYADFLQKIFRPIQPDEDVTAVVLRKGKRITLPGLRLPELPMNAPIQDTKLSLDPRDLFPPDVPIPSSIVPAGLSGNAPGAGVDNVPPLLDRNNTVRNVPGVIVRPGNIGITDIIVPRK